MCQKYTKSQLLTLPEFFRGHPTYATIVVLVLLVLVKFSHLSVHAFWASSLKCLQHDFSWIVYNVLFSKFVINLAV